MLAYRDVHHPHRDVRILHGHHISFDQKSELILMNTKSVQLNAEFQTLNFYTHYEF